jgi:ABC-type transporter Mla subunit MlaD
MRITTQMLNNASIKSGLPINSTSLLDYIKKDSSTTSNTLLNALNSISSSNTANTTQKTTYEKLDESAEALESTIAVLTSNSDDNIFAKAKEDGNTDSVKKQASELVSNYNDLLKKLASSGTTLDTYYKQMLSSLYTDSKESLNNIGITADKSGFLSIDDTKFDDSDIDTLEKALGSGSSFMAKASYIASRVENNAETNLESISSQYTTTGQTYSSYLSSKYNTLG